MNETEKREWAAKGIRRIVDETTDPPTVEHLKRYTDQERFDNVGLSEPFSMDTFAGKVYEIKLSNPDPQLISIMTGETAAFIDTAKPLTDAKPKAAKGDPWANLSTYSCSTCRFFVPKREADGRCRRHAPTMDGYPVVYPADWCGDHKLDTNPSRS